MEKGEHTDNSEEKPNPSPPNRDSIKKDAIEPENSQPPITKNETDTQKDASQPIRTESVNFINKDWNRVTAKWTIILGIGTIFLAICSIVGIVINIQQVRESDAITIKTFVKMERAVKSLEKSDSISNSALNNSEKSFEIQNRAYITIDFTSIGFYGAISQHVGQIKNFGHTPAYIRYATEQKDMSDSAFAKFIIDRKKLDFIANQNAQNIVLGESQFYTFTSPEINVNYKSYISGKVKRYVWGDVLYKDFFGKQHYTHFCGVVEVNTFGFTPIGKYNDMN